MVTSIQGSGISAVANNTTLSKETEASGGDFETFLRMLTTQLQNQDPLNPMESSEFAVQLATFSGVEQQAKTNDLLTQMLTNSTGGDLGQLSQWIGREVRTTAPVWYDGAPLTLQVEPESQADEVRLIVLDAQGRELSRESIGTGSGEVDWQGLKTDGSAMPEGLYQFRIESLRDDEVLARGDVPAYSKVTGAELTPDGAVLVLEGGNPVAVSEVTALRQ
ncbi:MAG: flagellar hook capping FlgD N-terminal domain-containing protein [Paracoccus sp. (in: a-proteobacteria)]|uniref:flagellar hook capping FlgD N-terminal domain-containing protein n=1 Tax=Paracoccus sp. TaxID=267 RepID=UPI0039E3D62B